MKRSIKKIENAYPTKTGQIFRNCRSNTCSFIYWWFCSSYFFVCNLLFSNFCQINNCKHRKQREEAEAKKKLLQTTIEEQNMRRVVILDSKKNVEEEEDEKL